MTDLIVIANGKYQSGPAAVRWGRAEVRLRETFGDRVEISYTSHPGDGRRLSREALLHGAAWLAAAGGDGTIHEVVNGFFDECRNISPEARLSFVPCGNGNDWIRTLGLPSGGPDAVDSLARGHTRQVDVGYAEFRNLLGKSEGRIFINIAEAGLGAKVLENLNQRSGLVRTPRSYVAAALAASFAYSPRTLKLALEGGTFFASEPLLSLIVANGRYFGAGMKCAPMARPDDGCLEVIAVGNFARMEILLYLPSFIRGTYLGKTKVKHYSVSSVDLASEERILFELDGELAGALPANIRILPQALRLHC
ncbi:MAG TPA: YegS/Rv2252/BmrU family lipid kinase [Acidobacteriota bacterium]|nr:YegS/Rv2252/BmrU family lipid kinase [Acidobacteriota bacterium]